MVLVTKLATFQGATKTKQKRKNYLQVLILNLKLNDSYYWILESESPVIPNNPSTTPHPTEHEQSSQQPRITTTDAGKKCKKDKARNRTSLQMVTSLLKAPRT